MNLLILVTIVVTVTKISGLPADYNGYPALQQYYEKYKNVGEESNPELNMMDEAKSKTEDDYPSEVLSDNQGIYNENPNLPYGNGNIGDSNDEVLSYMRPDFEVEKNQDLSQSGDTYPTQSVNEAQENLIGRENSQYFENETSTVTQASSDLQSSSFEETLDEDGENDFNVTLHVEGVDVDQNQHTIVLGEYQENQGTGNHSGESYRAESYYNSSTDEFNFPTSPELGVDYSMTTGSDEANGTLEQDESLSSIVVHPAPNQTNVNEFDEQRYLQEQDEFEAVFEDAEQANTNQTGSTVPPSHLDEEETNGEYLNTSEEFHSYNIGADSNQTQSYTDDLDRETTTQSEFILSQTEVERDGNTFNDEQTTESSLSDNEITDASEISDKYTQNNLSVDSEEDYEDDEEGYEDNKDNEGDYEDREEDDQDEEDGYEDNKDEEDDYEPNEDGTTEYQESTWQNDEEVTSMNEEVEDVIKQLEKTEEEYQENVLKDSTTHTPVGGPRYRSSIVPMLLLSLLVVGTLFLCTRAPAYCYNLFRIVRGADGFPFSRRLEKKGYMVLPMGDKSV